ncbi:MAG: ABC transporter ATP-binding protein [Betaproteobacteria bacterium]
MSESGSAAVALDGVSFRYPGSGAGVHDVTLAIAPGELLACMGPSGCGKTTLLRLVAGFLAPDAGSVALAGVDVTTTPARERACGVVFQSYALFPTMRAWENVAYPLRIRGMEAEERRTRANAMLERVGLSAHADRLPRQLSGGQQQRVALARALVFEPRALLLDEPLSALDAATRLTLRDEIRTLQRDQGIATLLITHDQDEALSLGDRVAVMRDGRLVQVGVPAALYDDPADAFVAGFVGRANLFDATVTGPEMLDTPFGRLVSRPLGRRAGSRVTMLLRPERVGVDGVAGAPFEANALDVDVLRDAFHGASRRLIVRPAGSNDTLDVQTAYRGVVRRVRIAPDALHPLPEAGDAAPSPRAGVSSASASVRPFLRKEIP